MPIYKTNKESFPWGNSRLSMPMTFHLIKTTKEFMKKISTIIFLILFSYSLFAQTIIKMKREGGISMIPCKVNGLNLELIFDTGASDVSISMKEATAMLENGELTKDDIIGTSKYLNADGDINEGIVINLKEIEIAGLKMTNVRASIVKTLGAPLLLGQTAISKLGKIQLDLNNNTLTILNGKGSYDYSTYSLTDKLDNYYKDFTIVKIEKRDNKEGLNFSYTIPKKWKEQKITNPTMFKNYGSDEYPYGLVYDLRIGLQTLPTFYNNYDSCQNFVDFVYHLIKKVDQSFKVISTSKQTIYFCKTIKSITFSKDDNLNALSIQYWIFCGNKSLSFIYTAYSSDFNKLTSISSDFDDFCTSQVSNIVVYNALENPDNCTIQSNAIENKTDVSIILNNSCKWFKTENQTESLNLINHGTLSSLSIGISNEKNNLQNIADLSTNDLDEVKKSFIKSFKSSQVMENFGVVTVHKKKYIYFKTKSDVDNTLILTDNYYYVINKRFIWFLSMVKDNNETDLERRYNQAHSDVLELLNGIEYIRNIK